MCNPRGMARLVGTPVSAWSLRPFLCQPLSLQVKKLRSEWGVAHPRSHSKVVGGEAPCKPLTVRTYGTDLGAEEAT